MPSIVIGFQSGGTNILSGLQLWSGTRGVVGGVQIIADARNSGFVYVGLSGGVTITSGGFALSGGGLFDGMQLAPSQPYFIPKLGMGVSGNPLVFVTPDTFCSGQARVFYEVY